MHKAQNLHYRDFCRIMCVVMKKTILKICLLPLLCMMVFTRQIQPVYAEDDGYTETVAYNPYVGGWSNCTWGTWQLVYEATGLALPGWHNAGGWLLEASQAGYAIGTEPMPNSIAVWSWHVAYVTDFDGENSIYIKEGGYMGGYNEEWCPAYGTRWNQQLLGYIYLDADVKSNMTPEILYSTALNRVIEFAVNEDAKNLELIDSYIVMIDDAMAGEVLKDEELKVAEDIKNEDARAQEKIKAVSLSGRK